MTQVDIKPPHFVIFVNSEEYFHFSYKRYLENQLRDSFDFTGTAVKIEMRSKEKRPVEKKRKKDPNKKIFIGG
jgi:GTP-binding protein